jgi:hypothetical protein
MVFPAIKPYRTSVTSPSHERQRQCLRAPVATSPPMTSPPSLGLPPQL